MKRARRQRSSLVVPMARKKRISPGRISGSCGRRLNELLHSGALMQYEVQLDSESGQPLAVVRRCAKPQDLGKTIQECCGLVWNVMRLQKVAGAGRHVS